VAATAQVAAAASPPTGRWWLGTVVPKRHARRAVTRNLIKRQMRATMERLAPQLPAGLWVLRLRAPFDPKRYPSAASTPLRDSARGELQGLLEAAVHALPNAGGGRAGGGRSRRRPAPAVSVVPAAPSAPAAPAAPVNHPREETP